MYFYQLMNYKFEKKNEQKAKKITVFKTWSRLSPSTASKLTQSYSLSWVKISFSNIRQFWFAV